MARLFHYATALRNIDGPEDISRMPDAQKRLAKDTFDEGRKALTICVEYEAYRESLKYGELVKIITIIHCSNQL